MDYKRLKIICRTLYDHLVSFDQANHMNAAVGMMVYLFGEPMTPGFDKFTFVQTGALLYPAVSLSD